MSLITKIRKAVQELRQERERIEEWLTKVNSKLDATQKSIQEFTKPGGPLDKLQESGMLNFEAKFSTIESKLDDVLKRVNHYADLFADDGEDEET